MDFGVLNPWMLLGLAGMALPILAHLLSRKKYDVVDWGAMQFLELSPKHRRQVRLEEILLLLLRIGMICLLVLAFSRPWLSHLWLTKLSGQPQRDVVLVIDGSYSMGWESQSTTPHAAAIAWVHKFLDELRPGDTVSLLDARDLVRPVLNGPTQDFQLVREKLNELPPPSGSSDLAEAVAEGVRLAARATHLVREVIVLTDGQARGWAIQDKGRWELIDELLSQASIRPRLWVLDVSDPQIVDRTNFALEQAELSKEFTAVNLPVRIRTKVRHVGGAAVLQRRVHLEVDGQRLSESTLLTPLLPPEGEFHVEFEHTFSTPGSHLLSVVLDEDNLPGDNRAEAAVTVTGPLPVLLVDGDPHLDPIRRETFFMQAALKATENTTPFVSPTVVEAEQFVESMLRGQQVVVLANVPRVTVHQATALREFVRRGGGLFVVLGDKVEGASYNPLLYGAGQDLLPGKLDRIWDQAEAKKPGVPQLEVRIDNRSLTLPLLVPFRREQDGGFTEARFSKWWKVVPGPNVESPRAAEKGAAEQRAAEKRAGGDSGGVAERGGKSKRFRLSRTPQSSAAGQRGGEEVEVTSPVVAAKLESGDPYLLWRQYGPGRVAVVTAPLDSDWSTLPAKPDFVPWLHEMLFHLAGGMSPRRNVPAGTPLQVDLSQRDERDPAAKKDANETTRRTTRDRDAERWVFRGPGRLEFPAQPGGSDERPLLRLEETRVAGVYRLEEKEPGREGVGVPESFVVNFDRREADLTPLDDDGRKSLAGEQRLQFVKDDAEFRHRIFAHGNQSEFWRWLMVGLMLFLMGELYLTRRLVRGGYVKGE